MSSHPSLFEFHRGTSRSNHPSLLSVDYLSYQTIVSQLVQLTLSNTADEWNSKKTLQSKSITVMTWCSCQPAPLQSSGGLVSVRLQGNRGSQGGVQTRIQCVS